MNLKQHPSVVLRLYKLIHVSAGTASDRDKADIANGMRRFGSICRNIIANMTKMVNGGGALMDQFFSVADKLSPVTEK
jgi:hypothetical protein